MSNFSSWIVRHYRVLALSCAVASFALGASLGLVSAQRWHYWLLFGLAAFATAGAVGLPMFAERSSARRALDAVGAAEEARAQMLFVTNSVLNPLAYQLGEITDAKLGSQELNRLQGNAQQMVLFATTELVSAPSARACYFRLEPGRIRRLRRVAWYGSAEPATLELTEGTPIGDIAFEILDNDEIGIYPDLASQPPVGWSATPPQGLLVVPVTTPKRKFGLITVDTPVPGVLNGHDMDVVRLLGELLAAALNR